HPRPREAPTHEAWRHVRTRARCTNAPLCERQQIVARDATAEVTRAARGPTSRHADFSENLRLREGSRPAPVVGTAHAANRMIPGNWGGSSSAFSQIEGARAVAR